MRISDFYSYLADNQDAEPWNQRISRVDVAKIAVVDSPGATFEDGLGGRN